MGQIPIPRFIANTSRALRSGVPLRALLIGLSLLLAFLTISPVSSATPVSGTISEVTTWALADSPYTVTGHVTVASGVTLTIEPGVTVKFDSGKSMFVDGTLVARGTSTSTITFTSSAASPAGADWGFIEFKHGSPGTTLDGSGNYVSGQILEHCSVEYGGYSIDGNDYSDSENPGDSDAVIANPPFVNNCTFTNNGKAELNGGNAGGFVISAGADAVITNSTFTQSPYINGIRSLGNGSIASNTLDGLYIGIRACNNSTVSSNTITGMSFKALELWQAWNECGSAQALTLTASSNLIMDNSVTGLYPEVAVDITQGGTQGNHIIFDQNVVIRNTFGVSVDTTRSTDTVTITNNTIADNSTGELWTPSGMAFKRTSGQLTITGNRIHRNAAINGNRGSGFHIRATDNPATIQYNSITGSSGGTSVVYFFEYGGSTVKGGVKVYQRGGEKLYQWTRQHDWERCRDLLKLGPSLSPDLNSSCCYA